MLLIQIVGITIYVLSGSVNRTDNYYLCTNCVPAPTFIFNAKECLILAWSILDEPPGQEGRALMRRGALP